MNNKPNPDRSLLHFMLRAQQIAQQDGRSDKGYAMLIVSFISIAMFSMLAAYMTMANLSKSSTNAYVNGTNSFYVAESGLNRRAEQLRQKFVGYATPSGTSPGQTTTTPIVTPANISNCFSLGTTSTISPSNDFECGNYPFRYNNNIAKSINGDGNVVLSEQDNNSNSINYLAYTFVADKTAYATTGTTTLTYPEPKTIEADQPYAGLLAQEYKYTVYATAAKLDSAQSIQNGEAKTVLQMDFKSRIVPLFQFGVFYDGDLDISSHSDMNVYGRVHTNKTLIITPESGATLTIAGAKSGETNDELDYRITAAGDIYTYDTVNGGSSGALRIVVPSSAAITIPPTASGTLAAPDSRAINFKSLAINKNTPLTNLASAPADYKLSNFFPYISNYLSATPVRVLNPPGLGFLRKTDDTGEITDYYGKADLRLTMQYDRAVPFDLTSIQTGTGAKGSTCADTGTGNMNISPDRAEKSTAKCTSFSKGQLNSLQQPVLVMTKDIAEEKDRFCKQANLNDITSITPASALNSLSSTTKDKILRALQVAIASSPTPVPYEKVTTTGMLPSDVQTTFINLLVRLKTIDTTLSTIDPNAIGLLPPATIAAIRNSCFLPAPIQKLVNPATGTARFYDRREVRAMKYLQTNIESLTVWNRDGVYVNFGTSLTTAASDFTATDIITKINAAFDDVIAATPSTYSTDGLLFVRDAAVATATTGSFQKLGLAAKDRTEGGLVFHATLDDTTFPIDSTDKKRKYNSTVSDNYGKYKSPFGFIFNDGANLPGPMTIASDQAIYTQGDYNNFGFVDTTDIGAKQPAALLADTITALSNACLKTTAANSNLASVVIPRGQVNCLINQTKQPATTTTVFAAYAANSDLSCGNLGSNAPAAYCTDRRTRKNGSDTGQYFGGGLQNFMRMLEDWTPTSGRQTFRYRGSMVNLGVPQEFNGLIVFGNVFEIPNRDFGFDPAFKSFDKLPPLSPRAVYLQQEVFKRTYN
ncbi:hypothetical protein [Chamaesiphon sp. OTE_20_metabat_361]|uniref:hypothetical protein n=1 Tax=Chamaesiphon sp. OTE_20_metabat_361 TaxID=2964689 RepID=UPI00286CBA8A|nr:hypothetical protein [Chamaesiphon sp. OTE_20_metabat_361]